MSLRCGGESLRKLIPVLLAVIIFAVFSSFFFVSAVAEDGGAFAEIDAGDVSDAEE